MSDAKFYLTSAANLQAARARLDELRVQALTGRSVNKPSDDPLAAAQGHRETSRIERTEAAQRSANSGLAALQLADAALDQVGAALSRIRELAVQGATDTMSTSDRAAMAAEVQELRETVRDLANTEHAGKHVFAGYQEEQEPFDAAGNYVGSSTVRQVEVGPGVRLTAGITGDRAFGPAGGTDLFATVDALDTALQTNDVSGVQGQLDALDASLQQVVDARAELGAHMDGFEMAQAATERVELHAKKTRADLVEVDQIESFMDLTQAQSALESAVQIAAQLPLPSLVER